MKKKLYILIVALGIVSCESFLSEENPSGLTNDTFYTTPTGFDALVNSAYASLRGIYGINPSLFEYGTDVTTRGDIELVSGTAEPWLNRAIGMNEYAQLNPANGSIDKFFAAAFVGIQRCNTAISRADKVVGLAEGTKAKYLGEVKFIRAYYYYLLVENFGGYVPIVENEISEAVTHFKPNSEEEIYNFILRDLDEALTSADPAVSTTTPFGRVTKDAVKNLMSLVYLTRGYKTFGAGNADFQKAAQLAEEVIASPNHQLLPSFANVFAYNNQNNKEVIFAVQYSTANTTRGNGQNILFGWRVWRTPGFTLTDATYNKRVSEFMPTRFLFSLYDTRKDLRYDATFLSEFRAVVAVPAEGIVKNDLMFYFPKPDQPFTSADSTALKTANPKVTIVRASKWGPAAAGLTEMFPMIQKFYDANAVQQGTEDSYTSTRDVIVFRLAETYLIAAEAYFKLGNAAAAVTKINAVRNRAEKPGEVLDIAEADVTIDFILDERARELAGEYKRWLDLKRTHKLDRAFTHNPLVKLNGGPMQEKYYLRPVPQTVIDRDTDGYPQNPDYQ